MRSLPPLHYRRELTRTSLLLLAGTDTTSSTLSRAIHLLSRHPEVQQRLRQELVSVTHDVGHTLSSFDYDAYANLPYLEAVVKETIRVYVVTFASVG